LWKGILSKVSFTPKGLDDPSKCKKKIWTTISAKITKGNKKCSAKKRFNVALLIAKPPHNHSTTLFPITGIAENKFVITVAPQNLIWPQGKT